MGILAALVAAMIFMTAAPGMASLFEDEDPAPSLIITDTSDFGRAGFLSVYYFNAEPGDKLMFSIIPNDHENEPNMTVWELGTHQGQKYIQDPLLLEDEGGVCVAQIMSGDDGNLTAAATCTYEPEGDGTDYLFLDELGLDIIYAK